jgi:kinesin family protein 5
VKRGVINLVDLAGSERVSKSFAEGEALEEAKKINQSLSTLGKVINSISKKSAHIPYRDSKLTRLLKESLGGNNKTTLIVNCSMHYSNLEETLSTLRFAKSAKMIQNNVKINLKQNKDNTQTEILQNIIKELKNELNLTKIELNKLSQYNSINTSKIMTVVEQSPREEPLRVKKNLNLSQFDKKIEAQENKYKVKALKLSV